jgi:excisionase family DNA binding protein
LLPKLGAAAEPEPLLTVRQVAERLGVSAATVYKLCKSGKLRHVRILNVIRVPPAVVTEIQKH